jgi:hypothetical protein
MQSSESILDNFHKIKCYWCPENWSNRLSQINFHELTWENEDLKKIIKSKEEKIEELKKEIKILKGLSLEEESATDEDTELWKIITSHCGDNLIEEEISDEELLKLFNELDDDSVSSVPIVRQNSGPYPKFESLFKSNK